MYRTMRIHAWQIDIVRQTRQQCRVFDVPLVQEHIDFFKVIIPSPCHLSVLFHGV